MSATLRDAGFARRRQFTAATLIGVMLFDSACYAYAPMVSTTPQPGQRVALAISDQGRAAMGDRLGSGVLTVEGRLAGVEANELVVGVERVKLIGGAANTWSGEQVRLPRDYVARIEERRLSPRRTLIAVAASAAIVAAVIVTANLVGFGSGFGRDRPRDPPPDS
jgi:hypothetical protein